MSKKQINVELPEDLSRRIKHEAVDLGINLRDFANLAFERFLKMPVNQRRAAAGTVKHKILGRPLKG